MTMPEIEPQLAELESIANPISTRSRGWVYVAGIIVGGASSVAAAVLAVLGLPEWQPVVAAAAGATATVTGILARANLS